MQKKGKNSNGGGNTPPSTTTNAAPSRLGKRFESGAKPLRDKSPREIMFTLPLLNQDQKSKLIIGMIASHVLNDGLESSLKELQKIADDNGIDVPKEALTLDIYNKDILRGFAYAANEVINDSDVPEPKPPAPLTIKSKEYIDYLKESNDAGVYPPTRSKMDKEVILNHATKKRDRDNQKFLDLYLRYVNSQVNIGISSDITATPLDKYITSVATGRHGEVRFPQSHFEKIGDENIERVTQLGTAAIADIGDVLIGHTDLGSLHFSKDDPIAKKTFKDFLEGMRKNPDALLDKNNQVVVTAYLSAITTMIKNTVDMDSVPIDFGSGLDLDKSFKPAVEGALKMLPSSWVKRSNDVGKLHLAVARLENKKGSHRAFYRGVYQSDTQLNQNANVFSGDGIIALSTKDSSNLATYTFLHEMTHRIQQTSPEIDAIFQAHHRARTKSDGLVNIATKRNAKPELARPDKYPQSYYGREYDKQGAYQAGALEAMPMAIGALFTADIYKGAGLDALKFALDDLLPLTVGCLLEFK